MLACWLAVPPCGAVWPCTPARGMPRLRAGCFGCALRWLYFAPAGGACWPPGAGTPPRTPAFVPKKKVSDHPRATACRQKSPQTPRFFGGRPTGFFFPCGGFHPPRSGLPPNDDAPELLFYFFFCRFLLLAGFPPAYASLPGREPPQQPTAKSI